MLFGEGNDGDRGGWIVGGLSAVAAAAMLVYTTVMGQKRQTSQEDFERKRKTKVDVIDELKIAVDLYRGQVQEQGLRLTAGEKRIQAAEEREEECLRRFASMERKCDRLGTYNRILLNQMKKLDPSFVPPFDEGDSTIHATLPPRPHTEEGSP